MSYERVYVRDRRALAYFGSAATADFWDDRWDSDPAELARWISTQPDSRFLPVLRARLPAGAVVLEGGCGKGHILAGMVRDGFVGVGLDFAQRTLRAIRAARADLHLTAGDVRTLPLRDASLDGYVSAGVIEHFWDGYGAILDEMARTIRPGGIAVVTFPYMSPIRRLKALLRVFRHRSAASLEERAGSFYQFALDWRRTAADFEARGFRVLESRPWNPFKGAMDEIAIARGPLGRFYRGRGNRWIALVLDRVLTPLTGHERRLVLERVAAGPR